MATLKIVITGANGQLGRELGVLSILYPQFEFISTTRETLPVDNPTAIKNFFRDHKPQFCINCAAYTAVDMAESNRNAAYAINAEAPGILAATCKDAGTKLIHISTDYVFEGNSNSPYTEESPTGPAGVYGLSKLKGEQLALQQNEDIIIIRTSWVYSSFGKNFVKTMLRLMHERKEINVVNDQYGSPTYAADLAEAILQIIDTSWKAGIYHFSNAGIITWYQFAIGIQELTGSACTINPIPTSQYPTPAKRPAFSALDSTKIRQTFGLVIKDWKESLAACLVKIKAD